MRPLILALRYLYPYFFTFLSQTIFVGMQSFGLFKYYVTLKDFKGQMDIVQHQFFFLLFKTPQKCI